MKHVTEDQVVSFIEKVLEKNKHEFVNVHGSSIGDSGYPDFITTDSNGTFLAIESKASNGIIHPNQLDIARGFLKGKGRYVVAYPDLDINKIFNDELESKIAFSTNEAKMPKYTHEIILSEKSSYIPFMDEKHVVLDIENFDNLLDSDKLSNVEFEEIKYE